MKVDPANVRRGADKVDGAGAEVEKIRVPDCVAACAGLTGFATAGVLVGAAEASQTSVRVLSGRFDEMGQLLRRSADSYEHQDNTTRASLTQLVGAGLTSLGDLNR